MCVWDQESDGEDAYVFGVEDPLREAGKDFIRVFREEGDGEGVDGELGLVGGEGEGQPGRLTNRESLIELCRQGVEVGCEGGGRGGRLGDEEGNRSSVIHVCRDGEGEDTVRIP